MGKRGVGGPTLSEVEDRLGQAVVEQPAVGGGNHRVLAPSPPVKYQRAGHRSEPGADTTSPTAAPRSVSPGRIAGKGTPSTASAPPPIIIRREAKTWKNRFRTSTSPARGTGGGTVTTSKSCSVGNPSGRLRRRTSRCVDGTCGMATPQY